MSTNNNSGLDSITFVANDDEIIAFTANIGKQLKSQDERDKTIVNQLIEYISFLRKDKENVRDVVNKISDENQRLNDELESQKIENRKLVEQKAVQAKVFQEQKEDFLETIDTISKGNTLSTKSAAYKSLRNILDIDEINAVKNRFEEKRHDRYNQTIEDKNNELRLLSNEINKLKQQSKDYDKKNGIIESLEKENQVLKQEIIDTRDSNFRIINDQKMLIAEQIHMMQVMEQDIQRLEVAILELDEQLREKRQDTNELLKELQSKEKEIAKAKSRRQKSTNNLIHTISHFYSESSRLSHFESNKNVAHLSPLKVHHQQGDQAPHLLKQIMGVSNFSQQSETAGTTTGTPATATGDGQVQLQYRLGITGAISEENDEETGRGRNRGNGGNGVGTAMPFASTHSYVSPMNNQLYFSNFGSSYTTNTNNNTNTNMNNRITNVESTDRRSTIKLGMNVISINSDNDGNDSAENPLARLKRDTTNGGFRAMDAMHFLQYDDLKQNGLVNVNSNTSVRSVRSGTVTIHDNYHDPMDRDHDDDNNTDNTSNTDNSLNSPDIINALHKEIEELTDLLVKEKTAHDKAQNKIKKLEKETMSLKKKFNNKDHQQANRIESGNQGCVMFGLNIW